MKQSVLLLLSILLCSACVYAECGASTNSELNSNVCFCKSGYWLAVDEVTTDACKQCPSNTYSSTGFPNTASDMTEAKACASCAPNFYHDTSPDSGKLPTCIKCPGKAISNGGDKMGINACSCNGNRLSDSQKTCDEEADSTYTSYIAVCLSSLLLVFTI